MQFKIPQDVEKEDKLLFFLSLRQLFILMGGGGIAYLIYVGSIGKIQPTFFMIPIVVIIVITVLLAFFKMENIDFIKLILLILEGIINPSRRLWSSTSTSWLTQLDRLEAYVDVEEEETKKKLSEQNTARTMSIEDIADIAKVVNVSPGVEDADIDAMPTTDDIDEPEVPQKETTQVTTPLDKTTST